MRKLTWVHTQVRYTEIQNRCIEGVKKNLKPCAYKHLEHVNV